MKMRKIKGTRDPFSFPTAPLFYHQTAKTFQLLLSYFTSNIPITSYPKPFLLYSHHFWKFHTLEFLDYIYINKYTHKWFLGQGKNLDYLWDQEKVTEQWKKSEKQQMHDAY